MQALNASAIIEVITNILGKVFMYNILSPFTSKYNLPFTVFLVLTTSIYLMFSLKFISISNFYNSIKYLLSGSSNGEKVTGDQVSSPVKSLFAIIAGSTGLGGIVGVSAITIAVGPGAAFWALITPLIGNSLRFSEVYLGHKYRERKDDGSFSSGPSVYLPKALASINLPKIGKILGISYGLLLLISSFAGASSYQSNQLVQALTTQFPSFAGKEVQISFCLVFFVSLVVFRNLKGVINFLSFVAPITIVVYFCSILLVIGVNYQNIWGTVKLIISAAFDFKNNSPQVITGMLLGASRVILATEIGSGTATVMHGNSSNKDSVREGILSMASPVISTFFVGFATTFIVVLTGVYKVSPAGVPLISKALSTVHPSLSIILTLMVPLMGTSVIIAWSAYGVTTSSAIFKSKIAGKIFLLLYMVAVFAGGIVKDFNTVLYFCDVVNIAIAVPNVIGIIIISPHIRKAYMNYIQTKNKTT